MDELFQTLKRAKISTNGLFENTDAGLDSADFRNTCFEYGIVPNTAINSRNETTDETIIFDKMLYEQRYTIERTNTWIDAYRTLLNRFKIKVSSCKVFNYKYLQQYFKANLQKQKVKMTSYINIY